MMGSCTVMVLVFDHRVVNIRRRSITIILVSTVREILCGDRDRQSSRSMFPSNKKI